MVHKKRVIEKIYGNYQISIIFVEDRSNDTCYHYFGRRKNGENLLRKPSLIDFLRLYSDI